MAALGRLGRILGDRQSISPFSHRNGCDVYLCGAYLQREEFPAVFGIILENFQNSDRDYSKSFGNIEFPEKSPSSPSVLIGFDLVSVSPKLKLFKHFRLPLEKVLFLLLMETNLVEVMRGMSLGEDKSIVIPDEAAYCAIERGGKSLMGRLLNPDCQIMRKMLQTMPKVWKVYERARGIALSRDMFQFVFDLETDIQMILKQGFWTFEDWGLALERWTEIPPPNYLQTATMWIRLLNIPVNYLTWKIIDKISDEIGHVKVIEFDPSKPHLLEYVRVQVVLDLDQPLWEKKSLTLPRGRVEFVGVEYERVRKKCGAALE